MGGNQVSTVRLVQTGEEVFHLRFRDRREQRSQSGAKLLRYADLLWHVRHRPAASALNRKCLTANLFGRHVAQILHEPVWPMLFEF